jgi:recombination protein RecT
MTDNAITVVLDDTPLAKPRDFEPYLQSREADFAAMLAGTDISPQRFIKSTLHALARSHPNVMKSTKTSLLLAVLEAAESGLEPTGQYGGAHLVPFWNKDIKQFEATLIRDYRGLIKMVKRSGAVSRIMADVVYEGDDFAYERGTNPGIHHVPTTDPAGRGNVTHVYAAAWDPQGRLIDFAVMTLAEVEVIRKRAASGKSGPWVNDPGEMMKKTAIRRLIKTIPDVATPQLARALEAEDAFEDRAASPEVAVAVGSRRSRLLQRLAGGAETASTATEPSGRDTPQGDPAEAPEGPAGKAEAEAGMDSDEGLPE